MCQPMVPKIPYSSPYVSETSGREYIPSKIRTAVGKSLTLRAAFNAAVSTDGEGTRSYAKALLRLRYHRTTISKPAYATTTRREGKRYTPAARRHPGLSRTPSRIYIGIRSLAIDHPCWRAFASVSAVENMLKSSPLPD